MKKKMTGSDCMKFLLSRHSDLTSGAEAITFNKMVVLQFFDWFKTTIY